MPLSLQLVVDFENEIAPNADDPLREVLSDLGTPLSETELIGLCTVFLLLINIINLPLEFLQSYQRAQMILLLWKLL